jgi:predicted dithiol-disulfide oxidoreductase (DUF899 family)
MDQTDGKASATCSPAGANWSSSTSCSVPTGRKVASDARFGADHIDAARQHFEQRDVSFVAVSRGHLAKLEAFKRRRGWHFKWVSSFGSAFNYDFGVSFTPEQMTADEVVYNYRTEKAESEGY